MNTDPKYWLENYPHTCSALEEVTKDTLSENANYLSAIAGDYADMSDDDVLATLINESLPR